MNGHERRLLDVGPYLLGTLTEVEARDFERHLLECSRCRAEVERLRPASEALPRSVEPLSPPVELKRALMRALAQEQDHAGTDDIPLDRGLAPSTALEGVAAERRRSRRNLVRRLVPVLAGGLALLALGLAVGYGFSSAVWERQERVLQAEVDRLRAPGADARLIIPVRGGEVPTLRARGLPKLRGRRVYEVWLKRGDSVVPQSLFEVSSDGSGTAGIPDGLNGVDAVMVTRERAGGARAPTGDPLLTVRTE